MCVTMNDCPNVVALRMSGKLLEQVISSERSNEGERDPFSHQEERIQGKVMYPKYYKHLREATQKSHFGRWRMGWFLAD